ncbi:MAG: phosphoenolpyruvate synthase, partial [Lachnospiraceae bacterium]|nr:phosphoenolpyruvate synthase [Lachnospiraceae bacterium]
EYVQRVADYTQDENLTAYCKKHGIALHTIQMTVIIQRMIEADKAGVAFTANPQGLFNESVIVVGNGTGDNVVEDKVDTTTYYYNLTDDLFYYERNEKAPLLTEGEVQKLIACVRSIEAFYGFPCDIEYAYEKEQLYLLQVRPITTLPVDCETIVLDNSNIVESYPGITLPLTQSFVREVYYKVFKRVLLRLTKSENTVEQVDGILQHMVDVANGRIYYRISNWYDVILFLPFHKKIIPVWQEMLGVQNKTVTSHVEDKIGVGTRVRTFCSFFYLLFTSPKKMEELDVYFKEVLAYFHTLDVENADNVQLTAYYKDLEKRVTNRWDITLVNDMYSFLFTALLKARLKAKKVAGYEMVTKQYISQIADIESMKPMQALLALVKRAEKENRLLHLGTLKDNEAVKKYLNNQEDAYARALQEYIESFGDRNLEELKLESKTFRTDPILLVQRILQYAEDGLELPKREAVRDKYKGLTGWLAQKAALGIRNRESSRMNRSRLYGMMRLLMLRVGENLCACQRLDEREDVFWLFYEEIEQAIGDETMPLKDIIARRKEEYKQYALLPAYSRLLFAKEVWNKTPGTVCECTVSEDKKVFQGIACSHGVVEGEVLVVKQPTLQMNTKDKILVTKMTDPGWVFLIADARAVVAEKGSLLSHTAIISRELGKPAVVGVRQITKLLKDGDYIRVDGDKGEIEILK